MRKLFRFGLFTIHVSAIWANSFLLAANQQISQSVQDDIEGLKLQKSEAVRNSVATVHQEPEYRAIVVSGVVQLLDDPKASRETRRLCINLLGELRAVEAADALVRHLWETTSVQGLSEWHFPAVQAIHRIGSSAIPALTGGLMESANPVVRMYAARTLGNIAGSESRRVLKEAMQSEKDPAVRQEIQRQLKSLQQRESKTVQR